MCDLGIMELRTIYKATSNFPGGGGGGPVPPLDPPLGTYKDVCIKWIETCIA